MKLVLNTSAIAIATVILLWQWLGIVLLLAVVILLILAGGLLVHFVYTHIYVRVPEHSAFIVYNRRRRAFERLLWPGRKRQFLHPLWESVTGELSTRPQTVVATADEVHTGERIPLTVTYKVTFQVAPRQTPRELLSRLLKVLLHNPESLVAAHTEDCLRELLGKYDAAYICSGEHHAQLSRALRATLQERVQPFGINVYRVMLGVIKPPHSYQQQINAAEERKIKAEAESAVLKSEAEALKLIAQDDKLQALWIWLEQLRTMEKNGTVVPALLPLLNSHPPLQKQNGPSNQANAADEHAHTSGKSQPESEQPTPTQWQQPPTLTPLPLSTF